MEIIDAHQHFWIYDPDEYDWISDGMHRLKHDFLPENLIEIFQRNDVNGCIAVQARSKLEETDCLLSLADEFDWIKAVVGWLDLFSTDREEILDKYRDRAKLKGFRHIVQAEPDDFLTRVEVQEAIRLIGKKGFAYDILIFPPQLPAAVSLLKTCPDQHFILDHLAKPYIKDKKLEPWKKDLKELATFENVWCKLSGLITEAEWDTWIYEDIRPYLDVALEAFGPDRLMFGSDWPVCTLSGTYDQVKAVVERWATTLSETEQTHFWYQNSVEAYKLG